MGWTFVWLMVVLKIPIAALFYIVWWAVHQNDDVEAGEGDDGGIRPPHPPRVPRHPRTRGPHGDPALPPPVPRTRTTVAARGRTPSAD